MAPKAVVSKHFDAVDGKYAKAIQKASCWYEALAVLEEVSWAMLGDHP